MEKEEALDRIELINNVIESSNKILFSRKRLVIAGIVFIIAPLIEYITGYLSFGSNLLAKPIINIIIQIIFYYLVFFINFKLFCREVKKISTQPTTPVLFNIFGFHNTIIITMFATIIILAGMGNSELVFPFVYLFFGLLFNFFGRFTNKLISLISWSYIVLGLIYMGISNLDTNYLWIYFMLYLGITYIIMGISIKNSRG